VTGSRTIELVAGLIRDEAGRVLLVRKRGTAAFMQPGGKRCRKTAMSCRWLGSG
jgi:8-oxo-dGTP diphosphatase